MQIPTILRRQTFSRAARGRDLRHPASCRGWLPVVVLCLSAVRPSFAADTHADLPRPPHGTRFSFEVIESHDAKYLGDTPAHVGKDGGLTVRPQVALGDGVYRTEGGETRLVGTITQVQWDRVSGSLTVEFDPQPFERVAVGDEVWIDLNPAPSKQGQAAAPAP